MCISRRKRQRWPQSNYNVEKITEIQSRFTGGEVYGSIVANRCNNQHILPLAKMSASSRCEYTKDLSLQFSQEQLGEGLDWTCVLMRSLQWPNGGEGVYPVLPAADGHTPVPPPQPASTEGHAPECHALDSPNTSDLEDESTDTEDTDDSREIESPPHPHEAPPHPHEAPPHPREAPPQPHEAPPQPHEAPPITQVALPTCVPSLCPPTMEEKRPTPPPRKKKMKAHSEAAASMLRSNDVGVSAVKSSLEAHLAPEEKSEQTVGKEVVQRVHRRKKKSSVRAKGPQMYRTLHQRKGTRRV
eukprot:Em0248g2a